MTIRDGAALAIKLVGLSYAANTLVFAVTLLAFPFQPAIEGFPSPTWQDALRMSTGSLGYPLVAWLALGHGTRIAGLLFDDSKTLKAALTKRDALVVGVILVGVSLAATHLVSIAKLAFMAIYYADGTRQAFIPAAIEQNGKELVEGCVACLTGLALAKSASRSRRGSIDNRTERLRSISRCLPSNILQGGRSSSRSRCWRSFPALAVARERRPSSRSRHCRTSRSLTSAC